MPFPIVTLHQIASCHSVAWQTESRFQFATCLFQQTLSQYRRQNSSKFAHREKRSRLPPRLRCGLTECLS
jgi:hypothetical protein